MVVPFDAPLRELTLQVIAGVRAMLDARRTPSAEYLPARCDSCSLIELCRPRLLSGGRRVQAWLEQQLDKD
jgi:CRISPR-associated exonuclease Cas4